MLRKREGVRMNNNETVYQIITLMDIRVRKYLHTLYSLPGPE